MVDNYRNPVIPGSVQKAQPLGVIPKRTTQQQNALTAARAAGRTPIKNYKNFVAQLQDPNLDPTMKAKLQTRASNMQNKFGLMPGNPPDKNALPLPNTAQSNAPVQNQPSVGNQGVSDYMKILFPQDSNLGQGNYIDSEAYNWQQKKGTEAMDKYYASRGLTNSGAELQGNADFNQELGSKFSNQAMQYSQADANRRQDTASRLQSILENSANRNVTVGQNQFNNQLSALELMLSQSPMANAYDAANKVSGLNQSMSGALSGSGGGGGGGGGIAPFQPYFPDKPDMSGIDAMAANFGGAGNSNWISSILGGLGGFLGTNKANEGKN